MYKKSILENNSYNGDIMKETKKFAKGFCFYKYFWIFVLGSVIGFLYEIIIEYVQTGKVFSKQELIYGPFTVVYGLGAVVFTIVGKKFKNLSVIFLITSFFGGMLEFLYSFFQERFFGTVSWDYSNAISNIDGRTTILYAIGWGILGVIYIKVIYPFLSKCIECIPKNIALPITWVVIIFMIFNINITIFSSLRQYERRQNIPPKNRIDEFYDTYFPDEKLDDIYQNRKVTTND